MKWFYKLVSRFVFLVVLGAILFGFGSQAVFAATVKFKIVAANPSRIKKQIVPIRVHLPEEIKPTDVLDLGGLELEFDQEKSLFYLYRDDILLEPKQIRAFEVEVKDIWIIDEADFDDVRTRVKYLLTALENTDYIDRMNSVSQEFEMLVLEIVKSQNDEGISRSQHIGVFRTNKKAFGRIKEKVLEMERILERELGPLTPDVLTKSRFKTESPTKTATWIAIFIIVIFLGLISVVVFFTWYRQSKATEKVLSEAKKDSFLDYEKKSDGDSK